MSFFIFQFAQLIVPYRLLCPCRGLLPEELSSVFIKPVPPLPIILAAGLAFSARPASCKAPLCLQLRISITRSRILPAKAFPLQAKPFRRRAQYAVFVLQIIIAGKTVA